MTHPTEAEVIERMARAGYMRFKEMPDTAQETWEQQPEKVRDIWRTFMQAAQAAAKGE
jgi:hypothetical protein